MRMPRLTALLTATAVFTTALTLAASAAEVHVLNWKGYGADEPWAVEAFEKATGNKVVNDFFNSEQEMLTKIRTNPGLYDVVMINAAFNDQAMAEKLIQPIDTSKLPNYADISKDKAGSPMLDHDGKVYGVPWVWGCSKYASEVSLCESSWIRATLPCTSATARSSGRAIEWSPPRSIGITPARNTSRRPAVIRCWDSSMYPGTTAMSP
jgi:hypothetical protein